MHEDNTFITLTYNDDHYPENGSLNKKDWQDFMKRLRKDTPKKLRYFMCGEYGEPGDGRDQTISALGRPHYHAIIFGHDFADKEVHSENHQGDIVYQSDTLAALWPQGFNTIGEVTFESAAYVARYVTKKITGDEADLHYTRTDPGTGENWRIEPEFTLASRGRRPDGGIGALWAREYRDDLRKGFVTVRGHKMTVPDYYIRYIKEEFHDDLGEVISRNQMESVDPLDSDQTLDRLRVKEHIKAKRATALKRNL